MTVKHTLVSLDMRVFALCSLMELHRSEKYAGWIMQNNYPLLDILIFSSGTEINVPELPEMVDDNLPIWKTAESNTDPYSIGEV